MNRMLIPLVRTAMNQAMAAALLSVALVSPAWAWSDHASFVWPLLRSQPELIHRTVAAEPLGGSANGYCRDPGSGRVVVCRHHRALPADPGRIALGDGSRAHY